MPSTVDLDHARSGEPCSANILGPESSVNLSHTVLQQVDRDSARLSLFSRLSLECHFGQGQQNDKSNQALCKNKCIGFTVVAVAVALRAQFALSCKLETNSAQGQPKQSAAG